MPDRVFRGFHQPPSVLDRLTTHMAETGIAFLGILRGVVMLTGDDFPIISPVADSLPNTMSVPIAVLLIVGGSLWILATATKFNTINAYWYTLRWSLMISGFGWVGYTVSAFILRPNSANSWTVGAIFALVAWSLYAISFFQERDVRKRGSVDSG